METFVIPSGSIVRTIEEKLVDEEDLRKWASNLALLRKVIRYSKLCRHYPVIIERLEESRQFHITVLLDYEE